MPQVPKLDLSVSQPQGPTGVFYNIGDATPDAFGAGVGREQQGLGRQVEHAGDVMQKHANLMQDRANEAMANDALVKAEIEMGDIGVWHRSQKGKAALDTQPEFIKKLEEVRSKYVEASPNTEVRRSLDRDLKRRLGYMITDSAYYAGRENAAYNIGAARGVQTLGIQNAGNAKSEQEFKDNVDLALRGLDADAFENRYSPEVKEVEKQKIISAAWKTRLDTIALSDPFAAREMYERNKEKINNPVTRLDIERSLMQAETSKGTKLDSDSLINGRPFLNIPLGGRREAIASIETPHIKGEEAKYNALGPVITDRNSSYYGDRAIGKYQVMGRNIPDWTEEALGKRMTIEEFRGNKTAQDAVFDYKFGQFEKKYGTPEDAASVWHSGRPLAQAIAAGAHDVNMLTSDYVKRFSSALGQKPIEKPGPLTTESGTEWLAAATKSAKEIAAIRAPNNPEYERLLVNRVTSDFNQLQTTTRRIERGNYQEIKGSLIELGQDGRPVVKSMDQIFTDPELNKRYWVLDQGYRNAVLAHVQKNAKADVPLNDERLDRFNRIMGMQTTNPEAFMEVEPGAEDLPFSLKKQIFTAQRGTEKNQIMDPGFQRALNNVRGMINDADVGPSSSDKNKDARYDQFVGAFQTARQEWMKNNNGKTPTLEDNKKIAAQLMTDTSRPDRGWLWKGTDTYPAFEVPSHAQAEIREAYMLKHRRGPTPKEMYDAYQAGLRSGQ